MRAVIEGIGMLFGLPVTEGKGPRYRLTVVLVFMAALLGLGWLASTV